MFDDDDFEELPAILKNRNYLGGPVIVRTIVLRGGVERLSFSISDEVYQQLNAPTPRFAVAFSLKQAVIRIAHKEHAPFEIYRETRSNKRWILRTTPIAGLSIPRERNVIPHEIEDGKLFLNPPLEWRTKIILSGRTSADSPPVSQQPSRMEVRVLGEPPPGRSALDMKRSGKL